MPRVIEWEAPSCSQANKWYTLTFDGNGCSTPHECLKYVDCGYVVCAHILKFSCDKFRLENDCKHVHSLIQQESGLKERKSHSSSEEVLLAIKDYYAMCPASAVPAPTNQELDSSIILVQRKMIQVRERKDRVMGYRT